MTTWKSIRCSPAQLRLDVTLCCGQAFRWRRDEPSGEWRTAMKGVVWRLKQEENEIRYRIEMGKDEGKKPMNAESFLRDYFQLDVDLVSLYENWSSRDDTFKRVSANYSGVRILRQDPVENLFSFICSSNNNIKRIGSMIEKMSQTYGEFLMELDGYEYHDFPLVSKLADERVESQLREMGFGYRAKYINRSAKKILDEHETADWLFSLRKLSHEEARRELLQLPGIGPKVADCICLMSLDKTESIPVDTHVQQIAEKLYGLKGKGKSLTGKLYQDIGDHFRRLFSPYAGWASSVLFVSDLRQLQIQRKRPREQ